MARRKPAEPKAPPIRVVIEEHDGPPMELDAWADRYIANVLEAEGITLAPPALVRRIGS